MKTQKRGLTAIDDKRYLCPDGINSLPFGHHRLPVTNATLLPDASHVILNDGDAPALQAHSQNMALERQEFMANVRNKNMHALLCIAEASSRLPH